MNRIVDTATEHELRAFLKHRKKELRLTDEECLCLRIRRRRLSLERKRQGAAAAVSHTHPHHAESQPHAIKLVCIGEEGSGHVALLQSLLCPGDEVLPVSTVELPLGDGQSCLAQLWAPETSESGKPLRSMIYECADAFLLAFDVHDAGTLQTLVARLSGSPGAFVCCSVQTRRWCSSASCAAAATAARSGWRRRRRRRWRRASVSAATLKPMRARRARRRRRCSSRRRSRSKSARGSSPPTRRRRTLRFERTDALLREFLTAPMPAVGVDTQARLLTLRERPAAGVRVHYAYGTEASVDAPFLDARRPAAPLPPVLPTHVSLLAVGRALYPSPPATLPLPRYCGPG